MSVLIAVEGLDGAGKRTLVQALVDRWEQTGRSVATLAFPRYGRSIHADIAAEALRGEHGDLRSSVYAMAMLFALDRRDAVDELTAARAGADIVILDRYVASNAAYSAARATEAADGATVAWVADLEFDRFGLPVPDHHLLLDVGAELALARAQSRAATEPGRERDHYERDTDLQHRTAAVYSELAQSNWFSPWIVAGADTDPATLADRLMRS
ncbi:dTMP kinase [Jongsikchunia kroppenstedtii]|uniref:dTMP kinase n=1 Tax=Jongsikchunia kroppenstedtii TaxID=1121721 RepID=UPI0003801DC8|nr:dTMP kinase [Jongsikchunia kroppenstedtii]